MSSISKTLDTMELLQSILEHLPPATMVRCRRVSQAWKSALDAPSTGMKLTLQLASDNPVLDTWSTECFTGALAKIYEHTHSRTFVTLNHSIHPSIFGNSIMIDHKKGHPKHSGPVWFTLTLPVPANGDSNFTPNDIRREMLLTDPPINHVQALQCSKHRDKKMEATHYDGLPKYHDIVQEDGVKLKHILELFEGEETKERWWLPKGPEMVRIGLFRPSGWNWLYME